MDLTGRRCCGRGSRRSRGPIGGCSLLQRHHLVSDHTALEVLLGEIGALLPGRRSSFRAAAVPRLRGAGPAGCAAEEHERYFAGLLGDVTEPTAPFGLLDVRGDGRGWPRRGVRWMRSWRLGCGSRHGGWG